MIKKILCIQICICILIVFGYKAAGRVDSEMLNEKRAQAVAAMSKHYTASDIWDKSKKAAAALIKVPVSVTSYVISAQEMQKYADPIDNITEGSITSVYAVSGGQVIETGENRELGKYIKIQHDGAVSVYGNCRTIYADEGQHVRQGQVIGSFRQEESNRFYYELIDE